MARMGYRRANRGEMELYEILRQFVGVSAKLHDGGANRKDLEALQRDLITAAQQHGFPLSEEDGARLADRLLHQKRH